MYSVTCIDSKGWQSVYKTLANDAFEAVQVIQQQTGLRAIRATEDLSK